MRFEFALPDLGEGTHEAEVRRWLAAEGQTVREDQPLVEVETDKAVVEIPSPVGGVVVRHGAGEGKAIAVGAVLAVIETAATAAAQKPAAPSEEPLGIVGFVPGEPEWAASPHPPASPAPPASPGLQATPIARRLAKELGVDLSRIPGTGPGGRITEADVRAQAGGEVREHIREERVPLRGLRKRIAERMVQSAFTAPHVTAMEEVDATELASVREQAQEAARARGVRITYLPFIIKAVVAALQANPYLNASIDMAEGVIVLKRSYHIGIATATDEGLLVPVIKDADKKTLWEIAGDLVRLTEACRTRTAGRDDLRGSTFTITNYGAQGGGLFGTPIINPPEVAILGIGRIQDRPVVRGGDITVRKLMGVSLSFDHRVADGVDAGRFLKQMIDRLEHPGLMLLD